ncbi:MAG TPA: zinc ABC transporter permease subunit ZnuB [Buchnera sp. (in: enterobacteria)]|nr:zinc ABC transporter permease subunit ZnuB [Buchnera sp. (in: enterobacteria)]
MIELFFLGWLAGILLTLVTGPLGSFIVWRRMSAFGDTLSHSSLLGLSVGVVLNINPFYTVLFLLLFISSIIIFLEYISCLALDTILGIITYSTLSLGMITVSFMSEIKKMSITNYFFGDLLTITFSDLIIIILLIIVVLFILIWYWKKMLLLTINAELAKVDGVNITKIRLIFILITAVTISVSIKFIGSLVIAALLVIPAATSQRFASSPENMACISILIGILGVTSGMLVSYFFHTPSSPSIVLFLSCFFLLSYFKKIH